MKILIANWTQVRIGGAESYIDAVLNELCSRDFEVACLFESGPNGSDRQSINIPENAFAWTISPSSPWGLIQKQIRAWAPDIVYCHGLKSPAAERWLQSISSSVLFAHNYYGTCISGTKTTARPSMRACERAFGAKCLALYLPCGCGGKNPFNMLDQFILQRRRLTLLSGYRLICTASNHMALEMDRHTSMRSAKVVLLPVHGQAEGATLRAAALQQRLASFQEGNSPLRLLFLGRIEFNKGAHLALEAATKISKGLGRDVIMTFVGDGSMVKALRSGPVGSDRVSVRWRGWLNGKALQDEMGSQDLLLVPSLWPEPFGLVGLEAGLQGIPSVSFGLGGIRDWLIDGFTGRVTVGGATTADALAEAAIECVMPFDGYKKMCENAMDSANRWPNVSQHVDTLTSHFRNLLAVNP